MLSKYCHYCGLETDKSWVEWQNCLGRRHLFCDNDCLRHWMDDQLRLARLKSY